MSKFSRRTLLGLALVTVESTLAACGGGSSTAVAASSEVPPAPSPAPTPTPTPSPPPPAPTIAWEVGAVLRMVADSISRVELDVTLPAAVRRGGTFGLHSSSAPLPAGITLSPNGWLLASQSARIGSISGVVFTYNEA